MEELDLLKKAWKKDEHSANQVSETEIYNMLHKKSSSIVKWILIISILEILLWSGFSILFNTDDYLNTIKFEGAHMIFNVITYVSNAIILVFIYLFYKNYVKISTTVSTKKLMSDILKTRKTVQYYVAYNLTMIVVTFFISVFLTYNYNPEMASLRDKLSDGQHLKFVFLYIAGMLLVVALMLAVFWGFYRLLYGVLLRKLYSNYKELKKIDL